MRTRVSSKCTRIVGRGFLAASLVSSVGIAALVSSGGAIAGAATKSPIKVMTTGTFSQTGANLQDGAAAIRAKVDEINAKGGIHGHKIDLAVCNDDGNPNNATTCARNAVSANDVAVLTPNETGGYGTEILPVLNAAGIPAVDEPAVVSADWTSPNSFPLDPGEPAQYDAVAIALVKAGCKAVGSVQLPVPAAVNAVDDLKAGLQQIGAKLVLNVPVGLTEPSYASQVAQLIGAGAHCIVPIITATQVAELITAADQSGKKLLIGGVTAAFSQKLLTSLGSLATGILLAAGEYQPTDTQVPAVKQMLAAMKKYTPTTPAIDNYSTSAWGGATLLFDDVMPSIKGAITAASVTKALEKTKDATVGTYAPYTFTKKPPNATLPRVRETGVLFWKVKGTMPHLISKNFTNIYQAMKSMAKSSKS